MCVAISHAMSHHGCLRHSDCYVSTRISCTRLTQSYIMTRGFLYLPSHSLHTFKSIIEPRVMAQGSVDAIIDPLHDAFRANILDAIKGRLADKGLKADLVDWRMLFPTSICLSATAYDSWCNLLRDPLFLYLTSTLSTVAKASGINCSFTAILWSHRYFLY